jgi:glycosyltransferase involved in cell wall biosynthesis
VRRLAGPNIQVMGYQPFSVLRDHMQRARAFVYAAEEDFGIIPVEAQACGTPVIAFGRGGLLETVRDDGDDRTGMFFQQQTPEALVQAVRAFEALPSSVSPQACQDNSRRFSIQAFREKLRTHVEEQWHLRFDRPS